MKLNFWQIVGILLLILGAAGIAYREFGSDATPPTPPAATLPATTPALQ